MTPTTAATTTSTSVKAPPPVPSAINTNVMTSTEGGVVHRHTTETYTQTYRYESEQDDLTTTITTNNNANNNAAVTNNNSSNKGKRNTSAEDETEATGDRTEPASQAQEQEEPYQELKWTHAPLFLNSKFDINPTDLLLKDKQTLPMHAGRTALLVVDVQPEYWSQCPAVRQDFPDFPQHLARLVRQCRHQKSKIIWVRADYRYAHSPWLVQFARLHQGSIPSEVYSDVNNQDDIDWEAFATPVGGEYIIPKTSWSTKHTALMDLLKQSGIDTVLVAGLITSVCVQHSAFGIFEAGYRTLLVTDACADRGKARHDAALALYGDYMYELLTVQDLCTVDGPFYLRPAKPVWLTPDSIQNLVQPQFFNSLQDCVVTGGHCTSTGTAMSMMAEELQPLNDADEENEHQSTVASNQQEHPTFYKVDGIIDATASARVDPSADPPADPPADPSATSNATNSAAVHIHKSSRTARTNSTGSLSTLTTPSPLLGSTVVAEKALSPDAIHI